MKEEEERLRADMRRDSKQRRMREKVTTRGISGGYLEGNESDEEEGVSLAAIKNKYKRGKKGRLHDMCNISYSCFCTGCNKA